MKSLHPNLGSGHEPVTQKHKLDALHVPYSGKIAKKHVAQSRIEGIMQ